MANQNYKEAFNYALKEIHEEYINKKQEDTFILWFNMDYIEDTKDEIIVSVKTQFLSYNMQKNGYIDELQNKLREITGQDSIIITVIVKETKKEKSTEPAIEKKEEELTTNKIKEKTKHPLLREEFNFDSFIPGENSELAYQASIAAAKQPGEKYNPILLYGGSGLGKTHLMEAIGNYIYQNNQENLKICYISAESFTNEFTSSISGKKANEFKNKYRNLDVLLLDDIHFLSGKEATQEELFYTFESLYGKKAQMVFTCDRPIKEIQSMKDRLVTRLANGMCIDLQPPNYETRIAIIKKKLEIQNKTMDDDILNYIAENIKNNVRELETAIQKVLGYEELIEKKVTLDIVKNQLKDLISYNTLQIVPVDVIQKVVADNYQVSISDLKSKKRDKKFVVPRQIAIYIAREITEITYNELGDAFGGKDHSTIMHAYEKISTEVTLDPYLKSKIDLIIQQIKEYKKE